MADLRPVSAGVPPVPARPMPAARTEAVKAAQRAFFDRALAAAAVRPSAPVEPIAPIAVTGRMAFDDAAPAPRGPLRPGSLLDIKV